MALQQKYVKLEANKFFIDQFELIEDCRTVVRVIVFQVVWPLMIHFVTVILTSELAKSWSQ